MGGSHSCLDCAMNIIVTSKDCMIVISPNKASIHAEDMGIQNFYLEIIHSNLQYTKWAIPGLSYHFFTASSKLMKVMPTFKYQLKKIHIKVLYACSTPRNVLCRQLGKHRCDFLGIIHDAEIWNNRPSRLTALKWLPENVIGWFE